MWKMIIEDGKGWNKDGRRCGGVIEAVLEVEEDVRKKNLLDGRGGGLNHNRYL